MEQIIARRAEPGYRAVRGVVVEVMQRSLTDLGYSTNGVDGIFGRGSEAGLKVYQSDNGLPATGALDATTWQHLFPQEPIPSEFELALALTSCFEGHGYTRVAGNFDGAGLTWGIIGFTLSTGELEAVLTAIDADAPDCLEHAFGDMLDDLTSVLALSRREQIAWADSISLGPYKHAIQEDWATGFARLGQTHAAVQAQNNRAREKYWTIAVRDAEQFELSGIPGLALCFDIAVQNGGINEDAEIRNALAAEPFANQRRRREIIAEQVALGSNPKYQDDVRSRKMTIARGEGTVHGARYRIADWGL